MLGHCYIFAKEAFSKREAWRWLLENAANAEVQGQVNTSIRSLAKEWQWHKSKVERFIKILVKENLITLNIKTNSTIIEIVQTSYSQSSKSISLFNPQNKIETEIETQTETAQLKEIYDIEEVRETLSKTENETIWRENNSKIIKTQDEKHIIPSIETESETGFAQEFQSFEKTSETICGTVIEQYLKNKDFAKTAKKEEKKKRTKKRKEEKNTKEKYSLKGIQKERYKKSYEDDDLGLFSISETSSTQAELESNSCISLNFISNETIQSNLPGMLSLQKSRKTIEQVEVNDIALWAANNLPESIEINLEWELGKFQDYYQASPKKLPKDGIAAFRNWLRKASEFKSIKQLQTGENHYGRSNFYHNRLYGSEFKETSGFARFIAGGLGAISQLKPS